MRPEITQAAPGQWKGPRAGTQEAAMRKALPCASADHEASGEEAPVTQTIQPEQFDRADQPAGGLPFPSALPTGDGCLS